MLTYNPQCSNNSELQVKSIGPIKNHTALQLAADHTPKFQVTQNAMQTWKHDLTRKLPPPDELDETLNHIAANEIPYQYTGSTALP